MPKPEKQQILIFDDFSEKGSFTVLHGMNLAKIFGREATLIYVLGSAGNDTATGVHIEALLAGKSSLISKEWGIPVRSVALERKNLRRMDTVIEENNGIVAVAPVHGCDEKMLFHAGSLLKMFRTARIPYVLCASPPGEGLYKKLVLPMNYYIENKEKALWASYFGRFHKSELHIIHTSYRDKGYRLLLENILRFVRQFFSEFELQYEFHFIEKPLRGIDRYAPEFARQIHAGMIIVMATLEYAPDDYLFGPVELKIMKKISEIPVMFINPRKDLYCMCD